MTPHGDTAAHTDVPFFTRVLFVAAAALAFIILGTTAAHALDLGEALEETAEAAQTIAEPVEEVAGVLTETEDVVAEPIEETGAALVDIVAEPVEDVIAEVPEEVVEPVETVVVDSVAQVETTAEAAVGSIEDLATEATETVIEPVEDLVGETVVDIEDTASIAVGTATDLVTETTDTLVGTVAETTADIVGQLEGTADTVVETTTEVLTTTLDVVADGGVTTGPETEAVTSVDAEMAAESPESTATPVDQDAAPYPISQLPSDPSWTPLQPASIRPAPTEANVPAPASAPDVVTGIATLDQSSNLYDAPEPVAPPATAIPNVIALAGSSPPGVTAMIVFLAAALLLIGHIAPRLTEWLRLRPLIWRDEGLALAIERPG